MKPQMIELINAPSEQQASGISVALPTLRGARLHNFAYIAMRTDLTEEHIKLRPFELEDLPALHAATRESIDILCAWMTWCQRDYSIDDCQSFLARAAADWKSDNSYNFAIVDRADHTLYGSITLNQINRAHGIANVGYWVRRNQSRRGIASKALRLVARFGLGGLGLERLEIVVPEGNVASQRVAQKAGATFEGVMRRKLVLNGKIHGGVIYSLIKSDLAEGKSSDTGSRRI